MEVAPSQSPTFSIDSLYESLEKACEENKPDRKNFQAIECYQKIGFLKTDYSHDPIYCILIKKLS